MAKHSRYSKKTDARRFASIGLWVSGAALISGGLALVVKVFDFVGLYKIPNPTAVNWWLWISVAFVIIGPAAFALMDPQRVRELLTGRQARYGSNAVILLVAFIGIVFVLNLIVFQNPVQGDWTEGQTNSLAPETIAALKKLPSQVKALAFYTSSSSTTDARQILTEFKNSSQGKFDFQFIDPTTNPLEAQQYKIARDATIVLVLGTQNEVVTTASEQDITNALVRLMNPGKRTVYFLTGHGEGDISQSSQTSFTRSRAVLESKNYTVQTLNLVADQKVPDDANVIVIAGATSPIPDAEVALLKAYVDKGGALVVLSFPPILTSSNGASDALSKYLTTDWGINVMNDLTIDTNQSNPFVAVGDATSYGSHPIMDQLANKIIFFPEACSLNTTTVANVQTTDLVKTISRVWGETDFAALQNKQLVYDSKTDVSGPLLIAVAGQNSTTNGRVVVVGDSDFANDNYFDQYSNSDMFINSVDWAAGQESMINLTSKTPVSRQMALPDLTVQLLIAISFVCVIPGLILAAGVGSWLMRRSRG